MVQCLHDYLGKDVRITMRKNKNRPEESVTEEAVVAETEEVKEEAAPAEEEAAPIAEEVKEETVAPAETEEAKDDTVPTEETVVIIEDDGDDEVYDCCCDEKECFCSAFKKVATVVGAIVMVAGVISVIATLFMKKNKD